MSTGLDLVSGFSPGEELEQGSSFKTTMPTISAFTMPIGLDLLLGNGAGEELERLQIEWKQLEHRRYRLSERTVAPIGPSKLSLSALQPAVIVAARHELSPAARKNPSPSRRDLSPLRTFSDEEKDRERGRAKLEEEREVLRAALSSRIRGAGSHASAAMPPRAYSPSNRKAEGNRYRLDEIERDLREKMRAMEQEKDNMRLQLLDTQERYNVLEKKILDGQREVHELKTELLRAEAAAKHNTDMWTHFTEKQQASHLSLQREKGTLATLLDSLKEENDSLRAKNKSIMLNSSLSTAEKIASSDAEIAALRKDREGFEAELQALKHQVFVVTQQLNGKNEEVILAVQETGYLRDQIALLIQELQQQKQRTADADARMLQADDEVSRVLGEKFSSERKYERNNQFVATAVVTFRFRLRIGLLLQAWLQQALLTKCSRVQVLRMRTRSKHRYMSNHVRAWRLCTNDRHRARKLVDTCRTRAQVKTVYRHLDEWLSLVRRQKRYDKLGFGKQTRREQRIYNVFTEWHDQLLILKTVSKWEKRDNIRRLEWAWQAIYEFTVHDLSRKKKMRDVAARGFIRLGRGLLGASFETWLNHVGEHRMLLRAGRRIVHRTLSKVFQAWCDLQCKNKYLTTHLSTVLSRWFYGSMRGFFADWKGMMLQTRSVFALSKKFTKNRLKKTVALWKRQKNGGKLFRRYMAKDIFNNLSTTFSLWAQALEKTRYRLSLALRDAEKNVLKYFWISIRAYFMQWQLFFHTQRSARGLCRKFVNHKVISTFNTWRNEVLVERRNQKILRKWKNLSMTKAWEEWQEHLRLSKVVRGMCRKFVYYKVISTFNTWRNEVLVERRNQKILRKWKNLSITRAWEVWQEHLRLSKVVRGMCRKFVNHKVISTFNTWRNEVFVERRNQKILRKWKNLSITRAWEEWQEHLRLSKVVRGMCRKFVYYKVISTFNTWRNEVFVERRNQKILRKWKNLSMTKAWEEWLEHLRLSKVVRGMCRKFVYYKVISTFNTWRNEVFVERRNQKILRKWKNLSMTKAWEEWQEHLRLSKVVRGMCRKFVYYKVISTFNTWRNEVFVERRNQKILRKWKNLSMTKAWEEWLEHLRLSKVVRGMCRKFVYYKVISTFNTWRNEFLVERRNQKILRKWKNLSITKAWKSWRNVICTLRMTRKCCRTLMSKKTGSIMRAWASAVEQSRVTKAHVDKLCGKILSNSRRNTEHIFSCWVEKHICDKEIHKIRDDRMKRHMLAAWRRMLVIERIFRQRVYNILPSSICKRESRLVRSVALIWLKWTRRMRRLSLRLVRCEKRLLSACFRFFIRHTEGIKSRYYVSDVYFRQKNISSLKARIFYQWLLQRQWSKEEALLEKRVVSGVKHYEDSNFTSICGNSIRCWALWAVSRRFYRSKEHVIQKHAHRGLVRANFYRYLEVFKIAKRHSGILSRCNEKHRHGLKTTGFAGIMEFTSHRRALRSVHSRKLRIYKSNAMRCWRHTIFEMTSDKQKQKCFRMCVQHRRKRGVMRFMHRWIMFRDHRRQLNKFLLRIAQRRRSKTLTAWKNSILFQWVHARRIKSLEQRWLRVRLNEWKCHLKEEQRERDGKFAYLNTRSIRAILRRWTRASGKSKTKHQLLDRVLKRKHKVVKQKVWMAWACPQNKIKASKVGARILRPAFQAWMQAALLMPSIARISETLRRFDHRVLLHCIIRQWCKYTMKRNAALFKMRFRTNPQFKVMKCLKFWQGLVRRRSSALCISDSVQNTVRVLYLSSLMRQWLKTVEEPESDLEMNLRNKLNWKLMKKYFVEFACFGNLHSQAFKDAMLAFEQNKKKRRFAAFRDILAYRRDVRRKGQTAVKKYQTFLLADFFNELRAYVLDNLLLDEGTYKLVREKTYYTYLWFGFDGFVSLWKEMDMFNTVAENFLYDRVHPRLMQKGFGQLIFNYLETVRLNKMVNEKYTERNNKAVRRRVFDNFCAAVDNQQRQYFDAAQKIKLRANLELMGATFSAYWEQTLAGNEDSAKARRHYLSIEKSKSRKMIVYNLKNWVKVSREREEASFHKHDVFLLRNGWNMMLECNSTEADIIRVKRYEKIRLYKELKKNFEVFVKSLKRRQLLYHASIVVRKRVNALSTKLKFGRWQEMVRLRDRVRDLYRFRQRNLCKRCIWEWCSVWLHQVYIGRKLVLIRRRFFMLHIITPVMIRWKNLQKNIARLLLIYTRILRTRTIRRARRFLWAWQGFVIDRTRCLRTIQRMMIRARCTTCRKFLQVWHRNIDKRIRTGGFCLSHNDRCRRKHLQMWHGLCVEQQSVKERATTYWVIIKALSSQRHRATLLRSFNNFVENVLGDRVSCSFYRRVKWQRMYAQQGSMLRRAFVTWRRHWIEFEHLGEALRRVLAQRRTKYTKVDLHHPFWAWVRYVEDRMNIRRETALVHKTSKILSDVLDVYGEPYTSDFKIRVERVYTIDDLISLLRKFHQHHADLKASAKLSGAGAPRVVSYGPIPYSHYVTTIGKQNIDVKPVGLSPAPGVSSPILISTPPPKEYKEYPPGIFVPEKYLGASNTSNGQINLAPTSRQSAQRLLDLKD